MFKRHGIEMDRTKIKHYPYLVLELVGSVTTQRPTALPEGEEPRVCAESGQLLIGMRALMSAPGHFEERRCR
jgi:hypothetical protein